MYAEGVEEARSSIGSKLIAGIVLAVAAWLLFKLVIGVVTGIATTLALIVLVVAIIWAWRQF